MPTLAEMLSGAIAPAASPPGVQVAGGQEDIEKILHDYAMGKLSAGQVRKAVPLAAPGYSVDSLRGNGPTIPVYAPDGSVIYMGT